MDCVYVPRIKAATALLVEDVAPLGDADLSQPSLLPGWDRAMVLTHLTCGALGYLRGIEAATRGDVGEIYPGGQRARDADIEAGRGASAGELKERLSDATSRLQAALETAPDDITHRHALHTKGEVEVGALVVGRLREVMVHHVDLDIGYGPRDWPTAWVMEEMDRAMLDLPGRLPPGVAVVLEATDVGQRWVSGNGDEADIEAPTAELFAWLTGRAPGVEGQDCPPLGPWR